MQDRTPDERAEALRQYRLAMHPHEDPNFDPAAMHSNWFLDAQMQQLAVIERHLRSIKGWVTLFGAVHILSVVVLVIAVGAG
jgi:hypothetical protein